MTIKWRSQTLLAVYAGLLTVAASVHLLSGSSGGRAARFEAIDVQRINIVEPDGTIRLVLSDKARFPGILFKGKEYPHPNRETAGILFYNDEGTENGGLTFGGEKGKDGKASAYGHLSFDQYDQDQVLTLDASEDDGYRKAWLSIWDRPEYSIGELLDLQARIKGLSKEEQKKAYEEFFAPRGQGHPRLFLGKTDDGGVSLRFNDKEGRERMVIEVSPDGAGAVRFLGEDGTETARFPAGPEKK
jgi:hypothetical protein